MCTLIMGGTPLFHILPILSFMSQIGIEMSHAKWHSQIGMHYKSHLGTSLALSFLLSLLPPTVGATIV